MSGRSWWQEAGNTAINVAGQVGGGVATGLDIAGDAAGGLGALGPALGGLGVFTGAYGMTTAGLDMASNGLGLQNGADMLFNGMGVGGGIAAMTGAAGTAISAGAGGVGAALGATALGTVGAVAGAGAAGYGVGQLINSATDSDYARSSWFGTNDQGQNRTANEAVIDGAVAADRWVDDFTGSDTLGDIVGGATAIGGSILAAPVGLASAAIGGIASLCSGW